MHNFYGSRGFGLDPGKSLVHTNVILLVNVFFRTIFCLKNILIPNLS